MRSVCIRDAKEAFSVRPRFPENFKYMTLDVQDNEEQNLIRLFPAYVLFSSDFHRPWLNCDLFTEPELSLIRLSQREDASSSIAMVRNFYKNSQRKRLCNISFLLCRRYLFISSICRDVRDATLSTLVGGCSAPGSKPSILYIAEWRLSDPDQGVRDVIQYQIRVDRTMIV